MSNALRTDFFNDRHPLECGPFYAWYCTPDWEEFKQEFELQQKIHPAGEPDLSIAGAWHAIASGVDVDGKMLPYLVEAEGYMRLRGATSTEIGLVLAAQGMCYVNSGRMDRSLPLFQRARKELEADPDRWHLVDYLRVIEYEAGAVNACEEPLAARAALALLEWVAPLARVAVLRDLAPTALLQVKSDLIGDLCREQPDSFNAYRTSGPGQDERSSEAKLRCLIAEADRALSSGRMPIAMGDAVAELLQTCVLGAKSFEELRVLVTRQSSRFMKTFDK